MFERNFKNVLEIPLENRETPTIQVFLGKVNVFESSMVVQL